MAGQYTSTNQLYEDFEAAFHACFVPILAPSGNQISDMDEIKLSSETNIHRFLDLAKQVESYFLNKRYILSTQRPDQAIIEENYDLRTDLQKKDQILQKYQSKINEWQAMLSERPPNPPPSQIPMAGHPSGGPQRPMGFHGQQFPLSQGPMRPNMISPGMVAHMGPGGPMGQGPPGVVMPSGPLAYLERTTSSIGSHGNRP